jgi:hypothetical protein
MSAVMAINTVLIERCPVDNEAVQIKTPPHGSHAIADARGVIVFCFVGS